MAKTLQIRDVARDAPIRLSTAAALAFPDGTMTVSGLRREALRGRLITERIAGKDFTTLDNVDRMRELCRVQIKELDSTGGERALRDANSLPRPSGSSKMAADISPRDALRAQLKQSRPKRPNKP
jgi:hypothetical protein